MSSIGDGSSIKLNSNIMLKSRYEKDPQGYLPADLLPPYCSDVRVSGTLSWRQREQYEKKLFYAEEIVDE